MKRLGSIAALIALVGCTSMSPQQQGTVTGTAIGAAAGAGIAAIAGGSAWTELRLPPLQAALLVTSRVVSISDISPARPLAAVPANRAIWGQRDVGCP